jgi:hypothetical protein
MASVVTWIGLDKFTLELENLPELLAGQGERLAEAAANGAALDIRTGYGRHRRTGTLQERVIVREMKTRKYVTGYEVLSRAPHALLFEYGTQARHTKTGLSRGTMPPGNIFVPAASRHRRQMYEQFKALLAREGFLVSGDAR